MEQGEFERFAETILAGDRSIQALEWAQVVAGEDRVGAERRLAAKYGFDARFTESDDGKLTVDRERSGYIPVTYIAPMRGNQAELWASTSPLS